MKKGKREEIVLSPSSWGAVFSTAFGFIYPLDFNRQTDTEGSFK